MNPVHATLAVLALALGTTAYATPVILTIASASSEFDDGNPEHRTLSQERKQSDVAGVALKAGTGCAAPPLGACGIDPAAGQTGIFAHAESLTDFRFNHLSSHTSVLANEQQRYKAFGMSRWGDDITYHGVDPGRITIEFSLHASWSDFGRFIFSAGFERANDNPDEPPIVLTGFEVNNCRETDVNEFGAPNDRCNSQYSDTLGRIIYLATSDAEYEAGAVDRLFSFSAIMAPGETLQLIGQLSAFSEMAGSTVDAFNTATLTRIFLEPGASITSSSGTLYPTNGAGGELPEPGTLLLLSAGLAGIATLRRRAGAAAVEWQRRVDPCPMHPVACEARADR